MSDNKFESENISEYGKKSTMRKLGEAAFEGLATFFFMITIFFSKGNVGIFAFGFWVILSVFGGISGAHVNPAITVGFYFTQKDWTYGLIKMGLYFAFQLIGVFAGILLGNGIVGQKIFFVESPVASTAGQIFFAEFFFTGTFFFFIALATHPKYPPSKIPSINTAIIVAWFYLIVNAGARLSGAAYNPAVLLALNATANFEGNQGTLKWVPIMLLGEFLGTIVFALIFDLVTPFFDTIHDEKNAPNNEEFIPLKSKMIEA